MAKAVDGDVNPPARTAIAAEPGLEICATATGAVS
jgi:hypothetical protein